MIKYHKIRRQFISKIDHNATIKKQQLYIIR